MFDGIAVNQGADGHEHAVRWMRYLRANGPDLYTPDPHVGS